MDIVKVRFLDESGKPAGREYSYFAAEPLAHGEIVQAPVGDDNRVTKALVVAINVPEYYIEFFRDKVKTIPASSKRPPTQAEDFIPETKSEGKLLDTTDYGAHFPETIMRDEPGPSAEEVSFDTLNEITADIPPALTVIQNEVGQPLSGLFQLYQEAASLQEYARTRIIGNNADLKPATDDLAIIQKCRKAMEARKKEIVGPLRQQLDTVNKAFNELMVPVLEADQLTRMKIREFQEIENQKAELARREAAAKGGETTIAQEPVPERTRTEMATLGGRDVWKARVVDFAKLSDEYKLPNESMLNAYARTHKGQGSIPGVEFYNDRIVTVRSKGEN